MKQVVKRMGVVTTELFEKPESRIALLMTLFFLIVGTLSLGFLINSPA